MKYTISEITAPPPLGAEPEAFTARISFDQEPPIIIPGSVVALSAVHRKGYLKSRIAKTLMYWRLFRHQDNNSNVLIGPPE